MKLRRRVLLGGAAVMLLLAAIALLLRSGWIERRIAASFVDLAQREYGLRLKIDSLQYSLGRELRLDFSGVSCSQPPDQEPFLRIREATLEAPYSNLWSATLRISHVEVLEPSLDLDRFHGMKGAASSGGEPPEIRRFSIRSSELKFQQKVLKSVDLNGSWAGNRIDLNAEAAYGKDAHLRISGTVLPDKQVQYDLRFEGAGNASLIMDFARDLPALSGPVRAVGRIRGQDAAPVVQFDVQSDALRILDAAPFAVKGSGSFDTAAAQRPLEVSVTIENFPLSLVHEMQPGVPGLSSKAWGDLAYRGGFDFWAGEGSANLKLARTDGELPLDGELRAELQNGQLMIQQARLSSRSVSATLGGAVQADRLSLNIDAQAGTLADLAPLSAKLRQFPVAAQFHGSLSGPFSRISVQGTTRLQDRASYILAEGTLVPAAESVDVTFKGALDQEALKRFELSGIRGSFEFEGKAWGNMSSPAADVRVIARDLSAGDLQLGEVRAELTGDRVALKATVEAPSLAAVTTASYVWKSGHFEVSGSLDRLNPGTLRPWLPEKAAALQGEVSGDFHAEGSAKFWKRSKAAFILRDSFVAYGGSRIDLPAGGSIRLEDMDLAIALRVSMPGSHAEISGSIPLRAGNGLNLQLSSTIDLKDVQPWLPGFDIAGSAGLNADIRGSRSAPAVEGVLEVAGLSLQDPAKRIQLTDGSARIEVKENIVSMRGTAGLWGAPAEFHGTLPLRSGEGSLDATLRSLDLATFFPNGQVAGQMDVSVHANGRGTDPSSWNATAALDTASLVLGEEVVRVAEPVRLDWTGSQLTVRPFQLSARDMLSLTASGELRLPDRRIRAEVSGNGDLALLSAFFPDLQANGKAELSIQAGGLLDSPVLQGSIRLQGAMLRVPGYPFVLEDINLVAPVDVSGIKVESFSAKLGGGQVTGSGSLRLEGGKPGALDFQITGRNTAINYPEGLRAQVDSDLRVQGTADDPELSGQIRVLRSQYREQIDYRDRLINTLLAQKRSLDSSASAAGRLRLNLGVTTVESFRMNNNLARLYAAGDLKVTGTANQPRISGQIRVRRGSRIQFEGNDYYVERGTLTFFGGRELNPVFSVLLSTTVLRQTSKDPQAEQTDTWLQEYRIFIPLEGPMDQLSIAPYSDPSGLSSQEIYSLLLTGKTGSLSQTASLLFERQLTAYISGKIFFDFQRRIGQALGFKRFEIQPASLLTENDPAVRLTLDREVAPGLQVQYSTLLSQHTEDTWIVSYRLKNRLNFLFVDQEDGTLTGGVRHNLSFGGEKRTKTGGRYRRLRVGPVELDVDSVLGQETVRKMLKLKEGQVYDPWALEDRADEVRILLQQKGYLFPLVDISETPGNETVSLKISVADRGLRRMEFSGCTPSKEALELYRKWWREGLSEATTLIQITDDLLRAQRLAGYQRARVTAASSSAGGATLYSFTVSPGISYEENRVVLIGNSEYPEAELLNDIQALYETPQEMYLDALHNFAAFGDRVTALYVRRGYLDCRVVPGVISYLGGSHAAAIREVRITEGEPWRIAALEVSGGQRLPADLLRRLQQIPPAIYDPQALGSDETEIVDYYQGLGYRNAAASARVRKEPGEGMVIAYDIHTGELAKVASIRITGNRHTRSSLIERQIAFGVGDVLTVDKQIETQRNLVALQLFRQVRVEPHETNVSGMYDVEIQVTESDPFNFTYGLRYDSELGTQGEVQFDYGNLLGLGQAVSLYGRISSDDTVGRLIFHTPPGARRPETLAYLPFSTLLSLSYEDNLAPTFRTIQTTINLQHRWELWGPVVVLGNYKYEQGRVTSTLEAGEIQFDLKQHVSRLIGTVVIDQRNDPLDPHRGFFVSNEMEYAPGFLKSELVFAKNYTQYFQYVPLGRWVSASAVRIGLAGDLIGSEHFFAGGQNTIRGFELDEVGPHSRVTGLPLGGEAVLILNQEFRFPIHSWIGGVVFYDGGNVYPTLSDFSLSDIRNTAGFGIRFKSPYGMLRMDLGFNLDPQDKESSYVLHIGLGQAW